MLQEQSNHIKETGIRFYDMSKETMENKELIAKKIVKGMVKDRLKEFADAEKTYIEDSLGIDYILESGYFGFLNYMCDIDIDRCYITDYSSTEDEAKEDLKIGMVLNKMSIALTNENKARMKINTSLRTEEMKQAEKDTEYLECQRVANEIHIFYKE